MGFARTKPLHPGRRSRPERMALPVMRSELLTEAEMASIVEALGKLRDAGPRVLLLEFVNDAARWRAP